MFRYTWRRNFSGVETGMTNKVKSKSCINMFCTCSNMHSEEESGAVSRTIKGENMVGQCETDDASFLLHKIVLNHFLFLAFLQLLSTTRCESCDANGSVSLGTSKGKAIKDLPVGEKCVSCQLYRPPVPAVLSSHWLRLFQRFPSSRCTMTLWQAEATTQHQPVLCLALSSSSWRDRQHATANNSNLSSLVCRSME